MKAPLFQPLESRFDAFKRGYRFRSSVTGRWVTRAYALLFPASTEKERIR